MSAKKNFLAAICFCILSLACAVNGLAAESIAVPDAQDEQVQGETEQATAGQTPAEILAGRTSEEAPNPAFYLLGKRITVNLEDGSRIQYHFRTQEVLDWQKSTVDRTSQGHGTSTPFIVTNPRPNIYFLDYLDDTQKPALSVTVVLDIKQNIATVLYGHLPTPQELAISQEERAKRNLPASAVKVEVLHAAINKAFSANYTVRHNETADLVGKQVRYDYRTGDVYEHQYQSEQVFTWRCLDGMEKGKTDTESCRFYKVADNLYFFIWWEKAVPTVGTLILDLNPESMQTVGKLAGFSDAAQTNVVSVVIDAKATVLE